MLLPGGSLNCGNYLSCNAQLSESAKRSELVRFEIVDSLVEADHSLLDDVLSVRPDQEVGARFSSHEILVLVDEVFLCRPITNPCELNNLLVSQIIVADARFALQVGCQMNSLPTPDRLRRAPSLEIELYESLPAGFLRRTETVKILLVGHRHYIAAYQEGQANWLVKPSIELAITVRLTHRSSFLQSLSDYLKRHHSPRHAGIQRRELPTHGYVNSEVTSLPTSRDMPCLRYPPPPRWGRSGPHPTGAKGPQARCPPPTHPPASAVLCSSLC